MYGIKIWSSEKDNDWYLSRDMNDGVVHVWDKKEDVERVQNNLSCKRSAITKIMSSVIIDRALNKRKEEENLKINMFKSKDEDFKKKENKIRKKLVFPACIFFFNLSIIFIWVIGICSSCLIRFMWFLPIIFF